MPNLYKPQIQANTPEQMNMDGIKKYVLFNMMSVSMAENRYRFEPAGDCCSEHVIDSERFLCSGSWFKRLRFFYLCRLFFYPRILIELAKVSFHLEKLVMVVLSVVAMLISYVVRGADQATAVATPETRLLIRCSINRHLNDQETRNIVRLILSPRPTY